MEENNEGLRYKSLCDRNLVGYGNRSPTRDKCWPDRARVAVQFVINYEEGAESCILNGDACSEHLLSDIVGAQPIQGERNMNMESLYEYGSRAGYWRLHDLFVSRSIPVTVYAVGLALEQNPAVAKAMIDAGFEVASHGYRWIDYQKVDIVTEREHIQKAVTANIVTTGQRPLGIYQGKPNVNTRSLIVEEGGFLYDSDSYADELPYWTYWRNVIDDSIKPHLVIPYSLDCNDMRFFQSLEGEKFYQYLKDTFDVLFEEGKTHPKMMNIGLHCRLARPGRTAALARFLDYVKEKENVWICRRVDIARHWTNSHPPE